MTNLMAIATIIGASHTSELKTNAITASHPPQDSYLVTAMYFNEKWTTTTVVKEDKLEFTWLGKKREIVESSIVSSNTVHMRIKQDWEVVK